MLHNFNNITTFRLSKNISRITHYTNKQYMESSTKTGIVLHIHVQRHDRKTNSPEEIVEIKNIIRYSSDFIIKNGGFISEVSDNAIIGVFDEDDIKEGVSEYKAASCANQIRELIYEHRKNNKPYILTASINGGRIIVGSELGEKQHEVMGDAITASFQLINATQPMQISLTRRVKDKLIDKYSFIARLPIYFGQKKALIFYLHRSLK